MEKSLKIVMVDDNTDFLFTMETFLERNGFEVLTADDGQKGMELIRKEQPDLIMLDIMMETLFSRDEKSGFLIFAFFPLFSGKCRRIRFLSLRPIPFSNLSRADLSHFASSSSQFLL